MSRHIYPVLLCLTLAVCCATLMRPRTNSGMLDLATEARAQEQGPGMGPGMGPEVMPVPRGGAYDPSNYGPQMPTRPQPSIRPNNWIGGPGDRGGPQFGPAPQGMQPGTQQMPPGGAMQPGMPGQPVRPAQQGPVGPQQMQNALIVARIGPEIILASDMLGRYGAYTAAAANGAPAEALAEARKELASELKNMTDSKLLFLDATKTIPPEGLKDIEQKITDQFEKVSLKEMMDRAKVGSKAELDEKLRELGSSVERRRQAFYETSVAKFWLEEKVKVDDPPYTQIIAYYQDNLTKFDHPAEAQWEEITVKFANFPNRAAAMAAIAQMGNDVLSGRPLEQVAKAGSQGPTSDKGGFNDWTTQNSLKSTVLDEAIFGLPVGRMSQVLEDADGYHIVRVVKRKEAGRTPFSEAQVGIRKQLKEDLGKKKQDEYLAKLREKTPVWTIFDEPVNGPSPIAGTPQPPLR